MGKGSRRRAGGNPPSKPLVYWGYEASPFCKVTRLLPPFCLVPARLFVIHIPSRLDRAGGPPRLPLGLALTHTPPPPLLLLAEQVVREVLNELEIPYIQRTVARGSGKRQELLNKKGIFQVPFIEDPNNEDPDFNLFESAEIIAYLEKAYG